MTYTCFQSIISLYTLQEEKGIYFKPLPGPSSIPSHPYILLFLNGMGLRLGNGISPCFLTFLRGGVSLLPAGCIDIDKAYCMY